MGALEGRKALVIGASSGSGRACALSLVEQGADVVFSARNKELLEEAVAEAGSGHVVRIDVLDSGDIERAIAEAVEKLGGLDLVLYTAGMSPLAEMRTLSLEDWQKVLGVNTVGPNLVIAAALPHLSADGIVGVFSSDSALQPRHSIVAYGAAKRAVEATMEGWRTEQLGGQRFLTIVLGPTTPTSFANSWPEDGMGPVIPHWERQGFLTGSLDAADVAEFLSDTFNRMFDGPTFGIDTVLLRAPEPNIAVKGFGNEV